METETLQALKQEVQQREIKLQVATAKASGAVQLYASNPTGASYHRALEFLLEAEDERMELAGFQSALRTILEEETVELTAAGAAVLTGAE
jgi:hypothetical protein